MQSTRRSSQAPATRARTRSETHSTASYGASLHSSTLAPTPAYSLADRWTPSPTTHTPSSTSSRASRKSEDSASSKPAPNKLRKRPSRPAMAPSAFPGGGDGVAANHVLRKMKSDISSRMHVKDAPEYPLSPPPARQIRSKIPPSLFPLPPDDTHAEAVVVPPGRRCAGNCLFTACTDATGFEDEVARQRKTSSGGIFVQTEVHQTRDAASRTQSMKQAATYPNHSQGYNKQQYKAEVKTVIAKMPQRGDPQVNGTARGVVRY